MTRLIPFWTAFCQARSSFPRAEPCLQWTPLGVPDDHVIEVDNIRPRLCVAAYGGFSEAQARTYCQITSYSCSEESLKKLRQTICELMLVIERETGNGSPKADETGMRRYFMYRRLIREFALEAAAKP